MVPGMLIMQYLLAELSERVSAHPLHDTKSPLIFSRMVSAGDFSYALNYFLGDHFPTRLEPSWGQHQVFTSTYVITASLGHSHMLFPPFTRLFFSPD
jgi:hypothetical protein